MNLSALSTFFIEPERVLTIAEAYEIVRPGKRFFVLDFMRKGAYHDWHDKKGIEFCYQMS